MTMDNLKGTESISRILLINREGLIKAGTDDKSVGIKLSPDDKRCQRCHIKGQKSIFLKGEQTFRYAQPIRNNPECYSCHGTETTYNGVIIIDFSTQKIEKEVRQHILKESLIFLASFMIMGFSIFALSTTLVTKRLNKIIDVVRRFKKGVDTARVKIEGKDELTELGSVLNEMAEEMKIRDREKDEMLDKLSNSYEVLKQSRKKHKSLVDSIDGIVWEADAQTFRFSFVSEQAERLLGYPLEQWLNEPTFWKDHVHQDDREQAVAFCMKATAEKRPHDFEYRMIAADGRMLWVRDIVTPTIENGQVVKLQGLMIDITERKAIENALRKSNDNLKLAQKVAHIGSWYIDIQNNELSWSDETYRIFGLPLNTLLTYEIFLDIVHPEDRDYVDRNWKAALSKQPYDIDHRIIVEGTVKWVHEEAELIFNDKGDPLSATGTVQDITIRKQAEKALTEQIRLVSQSQKEWQDTFDSITDLVSIHDTEFNIIRANMAFVKYFGLHPREVIGKKCYEVIHGTDSPVAGCPHKITLDENRPVTKEILDPKTNRVFLVSTFPFYSPDGELLGSVHIAKDVTEEKEKEMRFIMTERLASLGQMASGIAHEINNPLSAIAGCAEGLLSRVMKGRFEPELFENYLKIISEEIMRCKGITTSMLSFVRKTTYEKKEINMNETLDKTIEIIGFQGRLQRVEIKKDYKEGIITYGSEGELRQVCLSIITNALDAMDDTGAITLETGIEGDTVFIKITDTGPGIPQQHLNRIFDPFFTTKSDKGGTGLGLSIANKIVANHSGAINVISEEGKGTTFKIILPM